jgi:hypothetical protein
MLVVKGSLAQKFHGIPRRYAGIIKRRKMAHRSRVNLSLFRKENILIYLNFCMGLIHRV